MSARFSLPILAAVLIGLPRATAAAQPAAGTAPTTPGAWTTIATPAAAGSRSPNLASMSDGRVILSWLEPAGGDRFALRFAMFKDGRFGAAQPITTSDSMFVNAADIPGVCSLGGNDLVAWWLERHGEARGHDVRVARSEDAGRTWGRAITPHHDRTPTDHGFVSVLPAADKAMLLWLDGRKTEGHTEDDPGPTADMTLRTALMDRSGALSAEAEIDGRTCDCCPTTAVMTTRGPLVAWRDRSPAEVRDIAVAREDGGVWSVPHMAHADGWKIDGCPVNGPSIDARGPRVALVWYTAAADSPRVWIAFSDDDGDRFGAPVRIDRGRATGRVACALLDDGSALAVWLESAGGEGVLLSRRIGPDGKLDAVSTVAHTAAPRRSGFPRLARSGNSVLAAWTQPGDQSQVKVARLDLK